MTDGPDRFARALDLIDRANADDPDRVVLDGQELPGETLYARRMTAWLEKLAPDASESLRLAARAQHIRRWVIPRSQFPMDRVGYLRWRTTLYQFHADTAGQILRDVGYDEPTIARVQSLLKKQNIKADPDMQTLEDVICLVFLENYFAAFAGEHAGDEAKIIGILRKTWKKMSPRGHAAALQLPMSPAAAALVNKALSPDPAPDTPLRE